MFIDINKISPDGLRFEQSLALVSLEGVGGERIDVDRALIGGEARKGKRGVELHAHFDADLRIGCSRCLEPTPATVSTDIDLTLVPEAAEFGPAGGEVEVTAEDASVFSCPEGKADLSAIAVEQIYLNLPLKPLCSEGCRGLCPVCGANRNRAECGCRTEEIDPRLAPLLKFRTRSGDHGREE